VLIAEGLAQIMVTAGSVCQVTPSKAPDCDGQHPGSEEVSG